jgi:hypothetical protein
MKNNSPVKETSACKAAFTKTVTMSLLLMLAACRGVALAQDKQALAKNI